MTSEQTKCGLSSLLPMSCRGRAEAFARHLQSRLNSLGNSGENGVADENSWLTAVRTESHTIALTQPRTSSSDSELYFEIEPYESPGSPQEEDVGNPEMHNLLNKDNLKLPHNEDCHCSNDKNISLLNCVKGSSYDSDSGEVFFDTNSIENVNGIEHNDSKEDENFITTSECTLSPLSSSLSEGLTSCSLKDDECPSLENLPQSDIPSSIEPKNEEIVEVATESSETNKTYCSSLNIEKDMTIECPNVVVTENNETEISINNKEDEEGEEEMERIPRVRRCSSLKTGKTPPGTPGRKKIVRFADVLGLDLADVRTFLDEIPKVPTSAYEDLKDADLDSDNTILNNLKFNHVKSNEKVLVPLFQQPGSLLNFLDRIRDQNVCLENAFVEDPIALSIAGTVRVRNLDFHKSVHIRYSLDSWQTFADVNATYVENSCDGFSDKFKFLMYANTLSIGQRLEFAVRFHCKGAQYWDNNNGVNYCFQCLPGTTSSPFQPITKVDDNWPDSFYYSEDNVNEEYDEEEKEEEEITRRAVQDMIMKSLEIKQETPRIASSSSTKNNTELRTIFIILIVAILFVYLRNIYS